MGPNGVYLDVIKRCFCVVREGIVLPDVVLNDGLKENSFGVLEKLQTKGEELED